MPTGPKGQRRPVNSASDHVEEVVAGCEGADGAAQRAGERDVNGHERGPWVVLPETPVSMYEGR